jgi:hypothetical protein
MPYVHQEVLRATFSEKSGIKGISDSTWAKRIFLAALSELVKVNFTGFPGQWIHSAKVKNGVKTTDGLLAKLGYVPIGISHHKLIDVLSHTVGRRDGRPSGDDQTKEEAGRFGPILPEESSGEIRALNTKGDPPEEMGFQEYRTAVVLTLPYLSSRDPDLKGKLCDPLKIESSRILLALNQHKETVDAMNLAFAVKSAVSSKENKTARPVHFKNARGHLARLSANKDFSDRDGITYHTYKEIPDRLRKFLEERFGKTRSARLSAEISAAKRKGEMEVEPPPTKEGPSVKKGRPSLPDEG